MPKTTEQTSTAPGLPKEIRDAIERAFKVARERIESCNLKEHYGDAIDYLDENFAFFLTHVLNMGKPQWEPGIRTAAVGLPTAKAKMDDFVYVFNPTFAALLDPEEFAFIMAHETMHILLNHLVLLEKGKKKGKFKDPMKFNIAADCVINDYLLSMGLEPGRIRDFGMFGPDVVGYDCSNSTVSEVYLDVPDNPEGGEGEGENGDGLGEYMAGAGQGQGTGDHDWMHNPQAGQGDAAEEISKDAAQNAGTPKDIEDKKADDDHKGTPGAGPGSQDGGLRKFVEEKGVSMKWAELLKEVNPDMFPTGGPRPKPSYHKPRRKIMGVMEHYPDMGVLPVVREPDDPKGETPAIVLYMDGSGSCSHYINTFATLAKSVPPKKIKLFAFSFSTYVTPFDLEADNPTLASGGTAFSPIEESIRKDVVPELGHYPKAVVVLTDGEGYMNGARPEAKYEDRWLWMLTDGGRYATHYGPRVGRDVDIDKFCEGMKSVSQPNRRGW